MNYKRRNQSLKNISRRSFLKLAGLTTAATAAAFTLTGCTVASVFQITNKDGSIFTADEQEALNWVNAFLRINPVPFTDRVKVSEIEDAVTTALKKQGRNIPDGYKVVVNDANEDGYVVAKGNVIGTITLDVSLKKII